MKKNIDTTAIIYTIFEEKKKYSKSSSNNRDEGEGQIEAELKELLGTKKKIKEIEPNHKVWMVERYIEADEEIRTLDPLLGKEMLYH